jgi:predicted metalloendopeptidase
VSFAAFVHLTQKFDWVSVFAGIGDVDAKWDGMISIDHVNFFEHMSSLVLLQPMQQLRSYMTWRVLKTFAPFMTPPYELAMQSLDHMLLGTAKLESRWRKCLDSSTDSVRTLHAVSSTTSCKSHCRAGSNPPVPRLRHHFSHSIYRVCGQYNG